jgi:glycosyltransferase involved in cell wall biosynthesis
LAAGGAERVVLAVAGELAKRGYRCDIVAAQTGGRWDTKIPSGVRAVNFNRDKPLYALKDLVAYLRRERPAVLLSSVFSANLVAAAACSITGTRCVLREAFWAEQDAKTATYWTRFFNTAALRLLYRRADAVVALSRDLASHIQAAASVPLARVVVIPNPHVEPAGMSVSLSRDPDLLLACGRLEPQKDFGTLLEAFALLRKERPARLVVLGEGSQRAELERQVAELGIADAVHLAGYSDNVVAWMRQAKVFVSTSRSEGFPNVLLEALAAGCEVVSTASSDAVFEILQEGRFGRIVEVGNIVAIADAMAQAMRSTGDSTLVLQALRNRFGLSHIVDRYLEVLLPSSG